jgi:hypothetical protein
VLSKRLRTAQGARYAMHPSRRGKSFQFDGLNLNQSLEKVLHKTVLDLIWERSLLSPALELVVNTFQPSPILCSTVKLIPCIQDPSAFKVRGFP